MSQPLAIGTSVKVNCYHGSVRSVITHLPVSPQRKEAPLPLLHPLYEIELDLSRKFSPSSIRVSVPPNSDTVKLFDDEFHVLDDRQYHQERHMLPTI